MPKPRSKNPERGKQLTFADFAAKHGSDLSNALSLMGLSMPSSSGITSLARMATPIPLTPLPTVMEELKRTSLFRLLTAAGREDCSDACIFGSAREFVRSGILRGLRGFAKNDELGVGDGHSLCFQ